jgi:hypothetical protein
MIPHQLRTFVRTMKHSPIHNYGGIPGLTSWLVGGQSENGLIRLMECSREHHEPIIPHSHRFDFHCVVLAGQVTNIIWERVGRGDAYQESALAYGGEPGVYNLVPEGVSNWATTSTTYSIGDVYEMAAEQVHSIYFGRQSSVLFFEGPRRADASLILQPFVDGEVVPTFEVKPWAFKREQKGGAA